MPSSSSMNWRKDILERPSGNRYREKQNPKQRRNRYRGKQKQQVVRNEKDSQSQTSLLCKAKQWMIWMLIAMLLVIPYVLFMILRALFLRLTRGTEQEIYFLKKHLTDMYEQVSWLLLKSENTRNFVCKILQNIYQMFSNCCVLLVTGYGLYHTICYLYF